MANPYTSHDSEPVARLAQLENLWQQKFIQQPKLPTSALLTVAVSMALAFGGVLFALSASMRGYAWIWFILSALCGLLGRIFSKRWYNNVVIPWDAERRSTAQEIKSLREQLKA
jgi:hypothetical protein